MKPTRVLFMFVITVNRGDSNGYLVSNKIFVFQREYDVYHTCCTIYKPVKLILTAIEELVLTAVNSVGP